MVSEMRVLCLSELHDLTAMWAHYAAQATGVVLQFEVLDGLDSALLVARPVIYDDSPPAISKPREWAHRMIRYQNWEIQSLTLFDDYEHTKTTEWESEREWRISSMKRHGETGLFSDYEFNERQVNAVYFGWKCTEDDRAAINSLLTHGLDHVKTFDAFPNPANRRCAFKESTACMT